MTWRSKQGRNTADGENLDEFGHVKILVVFSILQCVYMYIYIYMFLLFLVYHYIPIIHFGKPGIFSYTLILLPITSMFGHSSKQYAEVLVEVFKLILWERRISIISNLPMTKRSLK